MSQTEGEHLEKSLSKKLTSCGVQPPIIAAHNSHLLVWCSVPALLGIMKTRQLTRRFRKCWRQSQPGSWTGPRQVGENGGLDVKERGGGQGGR